MIDDVKVYFILLFLIVLMLLKLTIFHSVFYLIELHDIDNYITAIFYNSNGFYLNDSRFLVAIRDISRSAITHVISLCVLWIYISYVRRKPVFNLEPHKVLFILWSFLLGSGLTVYIMKTLFARPRPRSIVDYGGDHLFNSAWSMGGTCLKNCSFPSGEGAAAMAFLTLVLVVPSIYRIKAAAVLVPAAILMSLNRVALGAHFFSDVVAAWLIMTLFMLFSWIVFEKYKAQINGVFHCNKKYLPGKAWE